jgi:hypothetical protein
VIVSGDIDHFSKVGADLSGVMHYEIFSGGTVTPGKSIPYKIKIWHDDNNHFSDGYYRMAPGTRWKVNAFQPLKIGSNFSPEETILPSKDLKANQSYEFSTKHTCITAGKTWLDCSELKISYRRVDDRINYDRTRGVYYTYKTRLNLFSEKYLCLEDGGMIKIKPPPQIINNN